MDEKAEESVKASDKEGKDNAVTDPSLNDNSKVAKPQVDNDGKEVLDAQLSENKAGELNMTGSDSVDSTGMDNTDNVPVNSTSPSNETAPMSTKSPISAEIDKVVETSFTGEIGLERKDVDNAENIKEEVTKTEEAADKNNDGYIALNEDVK